MLHLNGDVKEWCDMAFLCKRISALVHAGWAPLGTSFGSCEMTVKLLSPDNRITTLDVSDPTGAYRELVGAEFDYWWRARTRAREFRKINLEAEVVRGAPNPEAENYRAKWKRVRTIPAAAAAFSDPKLGNPFTYMQHEDGFKTPVPWTQRRPNPMHDFVNPPVLGDCPAADSAR